jgi:antitoxin component YwqK of YwqJK toxin-antitoxin module
MKTSVVLLAVLISIIFISCGNVRHRDFTIGKDGLYYKYSSHDLYSGIIIDTVDIIVQYSVIWGKKNGEFLTRYPNGQIEKFGFINNNLNEGEWKYYYPNGKLESKGSYENSKAQGKWIYFYPNGVIKTEGNYINSVRDGEWFIYDNTGKIFNIRLYNNGIFLGVQNKVT